MSDSPERSVKKVHAGHSRRRFLAYFSTIGLASTALPEALWAQAREKGVIEKEDFRHAERLAGLEFTEEERDLMLEDFKDFLESYDSIRKLKIQNQVVPAIRFDPVPAGKKVDAGSEGLAEGKKSAVKKPAGNEDLAFMSLTRLAELVRTRQVSSMELTRLYLSRITEYDPTLKCVINLTEKRALAAAEKADSETAAGKYRGPLHGIPWGAKDLLAVKAYPTTWGAMPYKDQEIEEEGAVVKRLDEAGAVLVAKLTLGALAWGDVWFGAKTRNPWNVEQGSSGSSAGPASAAAAGLVGFTIGSETWGSIVSPCTRCGATGLRPTFGRVSRDGAMALSWTMDKLGPICRSVEDTALVFDAIYGPDGRDLTVADHPFSWKSGVDPKKIRLGYIKSAFEAEPREGAEEWHKFNLETLKTLESIGFELIPIELPDFPVRALSFILSVEAAAAFDELTLSNRDDLLVRQGKDTWPDTFRQARLITAVEYVQANRARYMLMEKMAEVMEKVDLYVCPPFGGSNLLLTNLTGHPAVVLPNGFTEKGTPTSITFNGRLFGEAKLLAVAKAYQDATGFHLRHPDLEAAKAKMKELEEKAKKEKEEKAKEKK
jgi:Asp-tRNA(Asn)/Glu-tRNA(Gln) amidotransferase A subunit family amidase